MTRQFFDTTLRHTDAVLEIERLGDHGNAENAHLLGNLCHHRRSASAGTATHAAGDETHMGTFECSGNRLARLLRRGTTRFRLGPSAQTRDAKLDLGRSQTTGQRLGIGIGRYELNALHAFANHMVDRITAGTADTDHLDDRPGRFLLNDFKHLPRLLDKRPCSLPNTRPDCI
ncbi:hypothetical protein SDC9_182827 [bioreactor metagenome]|uniref:Uncharacterized protein n=1 Tax=bioreactor metagenome TaxID=1076179 RepID=A0A645H9F4_9ZZZZ